MNKNYRLVWNTQHCMWIAAPETAKSHCKNGTSRTSAVITAIAGITFSFGAVQAIAAGISSTALPTAGTVTAGSGSISQTGSTMAVNQQSQNLSLNWQSFNIGSQGTVNFNQPNSSAIAVNRIAGNSGSQIFGHLNANGQVYLINPNGILFGQGSQVNVGGLVASTLDVPDSQLGTGKLNFSGGGAGSVINQGTIAAKAGLVALLGNKVSNQGIISAQLGNVVLAGGSAVSLTFDGNQLLSVSVDKSTLNNLAENGQLIQADGGQVFMTAGAKDSLLASAVNNTGTIQAQTVNNQNGKILLLSGMAAGTTTVGGTLDASALNGGNGGFIETSGHTVTLTKDSKITTAAPQGKSGSYLIDPADFTIAPTGGNETGAQVSSQLATNGTVTIQSTSGTTTATSAGDIHINDTINLAIGSTLTLDALNNINVNGVINRDANGSATLNLNYGGTNGVLGALPSAGSNLNVLGQVNLASTNHLNINGWNYTIITNLGAQGDTSATTLQGMNGNLNGRYALGANIDASSTSAWNGGTGFTPIGSYSQFSGMFDGLGHTISGLTINNNSYFSGLLAQTSNTSVIRNIGLLGGSLTCVDGGELVGRNMGEIINAYATGRVTLNANGVSGGLVGENDGTITNAYATGSVGVNSSVNGTTRSGGLVGVNRGTITNAYATGNVSGFNYSELGGLVGLNSGTISNTYATGHVSSGGGNLGGLVGTNIMYPLPGFTPPSITNSYFDTTTTGQVNGVGLDFGTSSVTPLTTAALMSTPLGSAWGNANNQTTPYLLGMANNQVININDPTALTATPAYYTAIQTPYQLQAINDPTATVNLTNNLAGKYAVVNQIDASGTVNWNGGAGFTPIGTGTTAFSGVFDGLGYTVNGLTINNKNDADVGLFGVNSGTIRNIGLLDSWVAGINAEVGALVGWNTGSINNSYVGGRVSATSGLNINAAGRFNVGGLVGLNHGVIGNSYSTDSVNVVVSSGGPNIGGLVGYNIGAIDNAYATGNVTVTGSGNGVWVGGLVGLNQLGAILNLNGQGVISNVYATGNVYSTLVDTDNEIGGLVGDNFQGKITNAYATGNVTGNQSNYAGGLAGFNSGTISKTYATGAVSSSGNSDTGGLVGYNAAGSIDNSYASGAVTGGTSGSSSTAGLVGTNTNGSITDAYATGNVTGNTADYVGGLVGYNSGASGTGAISYTYAIGDVQGSTPNIAGLVGYNSGGTVVSSYWNTETSHRALGIGGTPSAGATGLVTGNTWTGSRVQDWLTSGPIATQANGWSNGSVWVQGYPYPVLNTLPYVLESGVGATSTYGSGIATVISSSMMATFPMGWLGTTAPNLVGTPSWMASVTANVDPNNVLATNLGGSGLYATGYQVTYNGTDKVKPASLNLTAAFNSKVYDGTTSAAAAPTVSGLKNDDTVANLTESYASKNVMGANGSTLNVNSDYVVNDTNGGNNYIVNRVSALGTITPATLTGIIKATDKVYDTTTAAVTSGTVTPIGTDSVVLSTSGNFVDKNVGTAKTVNVTGTLTGADAGNYILSANSTTTANITPYTLTSNITASNKVYDSTTAATTSGSVQALRRDVVSLNTSGSFTDKNVGTGKTVNVTGTLTGADAANYNLVANSTTTASIVKADLVGVITAADKIYDTTTAATTTGSVNPFGTDAVTLSTSGSFVDKNAGTGKTVNVTGTLVGADAANYNLIANSTTTANILKANLLGTISAFDKVYDATTAAITSGSVKLLGTDLVTLNTSGSFVDKNAGTGKTVNVTGTLSGADAGNYVLSANSTTTADITKANLSGSITAGNKIYDATTSAVTSGSLTGVLGTDAVVLNTSGNFADKNVGTAKTVNVNGTLTGADAGNYALSANSTTTADITKATLAGNITADNKVYDATISAVTSGSLTGVLGTDTVALSTSGSFTDKNAGTAKTVNVTGTLSGVDAGNYALSSNSTTTSDITPAALQITASNQSSTYGQTPSLGTSAFTTKGLINGDSVSSVNLTTAATSVSNVGSYAINGSNASGSGVSNYSISYLPGVFTVNPALLTYVADPSTRLFTQPNGTLSGTVTGFVNGQTLADATTGTLAWMSPATTTSPAGKYAINGSGLTANNGNYTFAQADANEIALTVKPAVVIPEAVASILADVPKTPTNLVEPTLQVIDGGVNMPVLH